MQKKLKIIYEDKNIIVVDKPSNLLTISTTKEKERTLYHQVLTYEKKKYPKNKIFIVHRLDKDTSGLVLFAKDETLKYELQNNWNNITDRFYYAVVEGIVTKKKDTLKDYLLESKTLQVHITKDKNKGKLAITDYEVIATSKNKSLLKIKIETGRKNQIRVQLANIGHPIVGDKKYNSSSNPWKRLSLHAYKLKIIINKEEYTFISDLPKEFSKEFKI